MANKQIGLTDLRRKLGTIAADITNGRHTEITHHGHPIAVLIPIADYQRLTAAPGINNWDGYCDPTPTRPSGDR